MKYIRIIFSMYLFLSILQSKCFGQVLLKQELQIKASRVKTYRTKVDFSFIVNGKPSKSYAEIIFKENVGGRSKGKERDYIINLDSIWTYFPSQNLVYFINLEKLGEELGYEFIKSYFERKIDIREPFSYGDVQKDSAIFEGIDYVNSSKTYRFTVKVEDFLEDKRELIYRNGKIWIGEDGLLRKMIVYDENQKEIFSTTFTDIILNPQIPNSEFQFTPPQECKVIDITEEWVKRLRLIKELREKDF